MRGQIVPPPQPGPGDQRQRRSPGKPTWYRRRHGRTGARRLHRQPCRAAMTTALARAGNAALPLRREPARPVDEGHSQDAGADQQDTAPGAEARDIRRSADRWRRSQEAAPYPSSRDRRSSCRRHDRPPRPERNIRHGSPPMPPHKASLPGAGTGRNGRMRADSSADPPVTSTMSRNLSRLDLTTAFQLA